MVKNGLLYKYNNTNEWSAAMKKVLLILLVVAIMFLIIPINVFAINASTVCGIMSGETYYEK